MNQNGVCQIILTWHFRKSVVILVMMVVAAAAAGWLAVVEARRLVTTGCSSVSGAAYVIRTVTKLGHDFPFLF